MSKSGWGVLVSIFFAIIGIVAPIPDQFRLGIFAVAVVGLIVSCGGWLCAHRKEKKNKGLNQLDSSQPVFVALDQLKAALNEGQKLLVRPQAGGSPITFGEANNFKKKTVEIARQPALALTPKDLAKLQEPWDEGETLRAAGRMIDHKFLANEDTPIAIYRYLFGHVKRVSELIANIESR